MIGIVLYLQINLERITILIILSLLFWEHQMHIHQGFSVLVLLTFWIIFFQELSHVLQDLLFLVLLTGCQKNPSSYEKPNYLQILSGVPWGESEIHSGCKPLILIFNFSKMFFSFQYKSFTLLSFNLSLNTYYF